MDCLKIILHYLTPHTHHIKGQIARLRISQKELETKWIFFFFNFFYEQIRAKKKRLILAKTIV